MCVLIFSFIFSPQISSAVEDLSSFDVYYMNGMLTSEEDAKENLSVLVNRLPTNKVIPQYNHRYGYEVIDILDVYVEKSGEAGNPLFSTTSFWSSVYGLVPLQRLFLTSLDGHNSIGFGSVGDVNKMVGEIKGSLEKGKKTLVVAHSQGNFFYSNVWQKLNAWNSTLTEQCFAGVGLASTLSGVYGNYDWTTSLNDSIINLVRSEWPSTLNQTITVPVGYGDDLGHSMTETYLAHPDSSAQFLRKVNTAALRLNDTCAGGSPCVAPLGVEGGQGNTTHTYYLTNTSPHIVEISFEAYSKQDSLVIRAKNNNVIASTGTFVSGFHSWKINYDPAVHGTTLTAEVFAPSQGTAWKLCIDCESLQCTASSTPFKRVDIYYAFEDPRQNPAAWAGCSGIEFLIDGKPNTYLDGSPRASGVISLTEGPHEFKLNDSGFCHRIDGSPEGLGVTLGTQQLNGTRYVMPKIANVSVTSIN